MNQVLLEEQKELIHRELENYSYTQNLDSSKSFLFF